MKNDKTLHRIRELTLSDPVLISKGLTQAAVITDMLIAVYEHGYADGLAAATTQDRENNGK